MSTNLYLKTLSWSLDTTRRRVSCFTKCFWGLLENLCMGCLWWSSKIWSNSEGCVSIWLFCVCKEKLIAWGYPKIRATQTLEEFFSDHSGNKVSPVKEMDGKNCNGKSLQQKKNCCCYLHVIALPAMSWKDRIIQSRKSLIAFNLHCIWRVNVSTKAHSWDLSSIGSVTWIQVIQTLI